MIYDIPKIFSVLHYSMLKKGFLVKQDAGSDDDKVKTFQQYLFLIKNKHSFQSDIDWNLYRGVNELTLSYKKDQSKLECTYGKKNNESTIELVSLVVLYH